MNIMNWILIGVVAAVIAFLAVILLRAAFATAKRTAKDTPRKRADEAKNAEYVNTLQAMIRCKTIFDSGDAAEYEKFRAVLQQAFPHLHERAELKIFGSGCLVYRVAGENAVRNVMLMSHHDVVSADGDWKQPPFAGNVADGALWGRGTVDTKTPLFAELQAVDELIAEGCKFEGINLYIASSDNEEVSGDGIPLAVEYFKQQGTRFDVVLDEGGAITTGMMPGVKRKSAMVAVHENGRHTFLCTAKSAAKGHLGLNPTRAKTNAISRMCAFITEVNRKKLFKRSFYPEVEATFKAHAPYMSYPYRLLFCNFALFQGLLKKVLPSVSSQVGGMLSTTMQFTMIEGGKREQVQPKDVTAKAFFRCVREEDLRVEIESFQRIAAKYDVTVERSLVDYCRPSDPNSAQFMRLKKVLNSNFPDVIVSPFLLTAGTDARHFSSIADSILRFAPIDLSKQQFASVHGDNENITLENISECVLFYKDFIKENLA